MRCRGREFMWMRSGKMGKSEGNAIYLIDDGSGLGLSIAKNLTVLQQGTFDIYLDGDLFKVTITFDEVVKEKKPETSGYTAKPEMPEEDLEKPSSDTI